MRDRNYVPQTPEERLVEWGKSLHYEPWNYWPSMTVLARIRQEGAGASQSTAEASDGGMGRMVDRMGLSIAKDRRCAEVGAAYTDMPRRLQVIVEVTYRNCPSKHDCPRQEHGAIEMSGLAEREYFERRGEMYTWLAEYLCLSLPKRRSVARA